MSQDRFFKYNKTSKEQDLLSTELYLQSYHHYSFSEYVPLRQYASGVHVAWH